jgi:hypothetical protein
MRPENFIRHFPEDVGLIIVMPPGILTPYWSVGFLGLSYRDRDEKGGRFIKTIEHAEFHRGYFAHEVITESCSGMLAEVNNEPFDICG